MLSLYYKIWVDAIAITKASKTEGKSWKAFTLIPISALMGVNLATILLWLRALSHREFLVVFPLNIFNVIPLDIFISVILSYFLPFVILNYLLIFNENRYNELTKMYKAKGGELYLRYIALTLGIFAIPYALKLIF